QRMRQDREPLVPFVLFRSRNFTLMNLVSGTLSIGMLGICYGLVEGQRYDWGTVTSFISIPLIIGAGVVLLAVFLLVQKMRQDREPLVPFVLFRSRNFTLMNWVSGTLSIGMLGIFLPLTIYLQSALGFSALKAGLTLAPSSVVMIILAPGLGRLTDKIGGKYILLTGLTLFAVGMGWVVLIATPHSAWYDFLAPMIVAGLGMGGTFPPMTTVAMRDVDPRMAGAASGELNTVRQVGSVIGTAAVGALLQNRLVSSLTSQATIASASLPPQARGPFVSGFRQAASTGLIGGAPASSAAPAGASPGLAAQLHRLGAEVFSTGYVLAMRWTMVMPIVVVLIAAASCLAIKNKPAGQDRAAAAEDSQMAGTISSPGSPGQSPGSSSGTGS
ncbi:MAG: MFS transporter, partial [Streptosporangiaceae bacterium]